MIQNILVVVALIVAFYILADAFILTPKKSAGKSKACGSNSKQCGCS